jgi:hypothetical protein
MLCTIRIHVRKIDDDDDDDRKMLRKRKEEKKKCLRFFGS